MRRARKIRVERDFSLCPVCGYTDGFHVVFSRGAEKGKYNAYLICPMCSAAYNIGLRCETTQEGELE